MNTHGNWMYDIKWELNEKEKQICIMYLMVIMIIIIREFICEHPHDRRHFHNVRMCSCIEV